MRTFAPRLVALSAFLGLSCSLFVVSADAAPAKAKRAPARTHRHQGGSGAAAVTPVVAKGGKTARVVPAPRALSVGSPTDGKLENGLRVEPSAALRFAPAYAHNDVRWGLPSIVHMINRASNQVAKRFAGSVMNLGHVSQQHGGEVDRHASHESGRDADIGFYVKNAQGKQLLSDSFVSFDGNGKAEHWPGALFDDARNWELVAALVTDPEVHISHIFVATPLRDRLLSYAKHVGAHPDIRDRASELLAQPRGSLPHDDHFHVRISCPKNMTQCVEIPTPAKHRKNPIARHSGSATDHPASTAAASKHTATAKSGSASKTSEARQPKPAPVPPKTAEKPEEEDGLSKLLGPRVQGLDSVVIPARIEKTEKGEAAPSPAATPKSDEKAAPAPPFDDVDGPVQSSPDEH